MFLVVTNRYFKFILFMTMTKLIMRLNYLNKFKRTKWWHGYYLLNAFFDEQWPQNGSQWKFVHSLLSGSGRSLGKGFYRFGRLMIMIRQSHSFVVSNYSYYNNALGNSIARLPFSVAIGAPMQYIVSDGGRVIEVTGG